MVQPKIEYGGRVLNIFETRRLLNAIEAIDGQTVDEIVMEAEDTVLLRELARAAICGASVDGGKAPRGMNKSPEC